MEDKAYFDAMFNGLKDLMVSQNANMNLHISAVSGNVKVLEKNFNDHKDSENAHGLGGRDKSSGSIAGWLGLCVSMATLAVMLLRH